MNSLQKLTIILKNNFDGFLDENGAVPVGSLKMYPSYILEALDRNQYAEDFEQYIIEMPEFELDLAKQESAFDSDIILSEIIECYQEIYCDPYDSGCPCDCNDY